jgi:ADP-heptose:LPS heptosyltransferase
MKYYKTLNNEIYAYEDNVNQEIINERSERLELIQITEEEVESIQKQKDLDNKVAEKQEKFKLKLFLNESNYIVINLGKKFTIEERTKYFNKISKKFNMTNLEVMNKQEEAIKRINELELIINN